ncbi:MAG: hypothetical protein AAGM38_06405 [Pseudomonadota bacterium]
MHLGHYGSAAVQTRQASNLLVSKYGPTMKYALCIPGLSLDVADFFSTIPFNVELHIKEHQYVNQGDKLFTISRTEKSRNPTFFELITSGVKEPVVIERFTTSSSMTARVGYLFQPQIFSLSRWDNEKHYPRVPRVITDIARDCFLVIAVHEPIEKKAIDFYESIFDRVFDSTEEFSRLSREDVCYKDDWYEKFCRDYNFLSQNNCAVFQKDAFFDLAESQADDAIKATTLARYNRMFAS